MAAGTGVSVPRSAKRRATASDALALVGPLTLASGSLAARAQAFGGDMIEGAQDLSFALPLASLPLPTPGVAVTPPATAAAGAARAPEASGTAIAASVLDSGAGAIRRHRFRPPRATPHDRAAAYALLKAEYAYERALLANAPESEAAARAVAAKLGGECPDVLADAPREFERERFESPRPPARERGEASLRQRQRSGLLLELSESVLRAYQEPERPAALAYARAIRSLRWSSRTLTTYVHEIATRAERGSPAAALAVCADLRFWAATGYRALSPATKAFIGERERALARLSAPGPDPSAILRAFEGPAAKRLSRKLTRLVRSAIAALGEAERLLEALRHTLGIPSPREEEQSPPKDAVVIARTRTAAGASLVAWVRHPTPPGAGSAHCPIDLEYEVSEGPSSGGSDVCLSRTHPATLQLFCQGTRWQIEGQAAEGATEAHLKLRGGQEVTSALVLVPATLGGPAGFYFQRLRPSQVPAALEELSSEGKLLRTVPFKAKRRCDRQPPKGRGPLGSPQPLAGAVLVTGRIPHGPRFQITGERFRLIPTSARSRPIRPVRRLNRP
jgi:hypothetical protein